MKKFTPSQVLSPGPRFEPRLVPPQWDPKLKSNGQRNLTIRWHLSLQVSRDVIKLIEVLGFQRSVN